MSHISFVMRNTREPVGEAPIVGWWAVAGQLNPIIALIKDLPSLYKMRELMRLGNDFHKPPNQVVLSELDLVEWYRCTVKAMYGLTARAGHDLDAFLANPNIKGFDITKTFAYRDMQSMVELMALILVLIDARCDIIAEEVRIPNLQAI